MKRIIEFDSAPDTFRGPIVDWCKSLRNSTIHEIKLLSGPKSSNPAPLSVVVLLQDGSMYRLQRTVKWAKAQIMPNIQDTIERVSAAELGPVTPVAQSFVTIKFKQDCYPNLLTLLRVCHGVQKHGMIFKASHVIMDCSDNFFALALVLTVTRSSLPLRTYASTAASDCTPLEGLWQEVYQSLQKQGYAFWENTIAEHTTNLTRELIYRLARHKVLFLLESQEASLSVAASTVSRIESLVRNKGLSDTIVWDEAWDRRWSQIWRQRRLALTPAYSGTKRKIIATGARSEISIAVDGCAAGRISGRTLANLPPTKNSSILLNAFCKGPHGRPPKISLYIPTTREGESHDIVLDKSHQTEITVPNVPSISGIEGYNTSINWLGNSCFLDSDTYQIWATPRDSAIESAWAAAWPVAESRGRVAATDANQPDGDIAYLAAPAGTNSRARTTHPATQAVTRFAMWAGRRLSTSLPSPNKASRDQGSPKVVAGSRTHPTGRTDTGLATAPPDQPLETDPSIPMANSPATDSIRDSSQTIVASIMATSPVSIIHTPISPRSRKPSEASNKQKQPGVSEAGLQPISEASHADLPSQIPALSIPPKPPFKRAASEPFPVHTPVQAPGRRYTEASDPPINVEFPRRRSESATKRLRKHVVSRWSDSQRYSDFEDAFTGKAQERNYREKKEQAWKQAAQTVTNSTPVEDLQELAQEAWERAVAFSGEDHFKQMINSLAQQEWDKLVERHKKTAPSASLGTKPSTWETDFMSIWQEAWRESWVGAWTAVWNLSYKEASLRGTEFGIEDVLDQDPKFQRRTYKELESSEAYGVLKQSLTDNQSPSGSLEQVHQWMKELGYLSESLQYSVPTLRDECMEITVTRSVEVKLPHALMGRPTATETRLESIRISHYDLQGWFADSYIPKRVHHDKQVHNLFLRGIAEVWESVSQLN